MTRHLLALLLLCVCGFLHTSAATAKWSGDAPPPRSLRAQDDALAAATPQVSVPLERWLQAKLKAANIVYVSTGFGIVPMDTGRMRFSDARWRSLSRREQNAANNVAYARSVKGRKSQSVIDILGVGHRSEIIHRDNLVLLQGVEAKAT